MLVVLTGAEGTVGSGFREEYLAKYRQAYDLRLAVNDAAFTDPRFDDVVRFDLTDLGSVRDALRGADAVVGLAANADGDAPWGELLGPNVVGAFNLLEAARLEGLSRVVLASSVQAVDGYPPDRLVLEDDPPMPNSVYGATKAFGEALAGAYFSMHGLSSLAVRIGGYVTPEQEALLADVENPRYLDIVITQRDLGQLIHRCLMAPPDAGFAVLHALSENRRKRLDLARARELVGYEPQDDAFEIVNRPVQSAPETA
jgi:uronate dehydrogenase